MMSSHDLCNMPSSVSVIIYLCNYSEYWTEGKLRYANIYTTRLTQVDLFVYMFTAITANKQLQCCKMYSIKRKQNGIDRLHSIKNYGNAMNMTLATSAFRYDCKWGKRNIAHDTRDGGNAFFYKSPKWPRGTVWGGAICDWNKPVFYSECSQFYFTLVSQI